MIVDRINAYLSKSEKNLDESLKFEVEKLAGVAFKRQFMTDRDGVAKGTLRLSAAGRCARQLAYAYHGFEEKGKERDARASMIFWTGDLVELTIVSLAKIAGCRIAFSGFNQTRVSFQVSESIHIEGHPDGLLFEDGNIYLIEIKSMSSYGFEKFEKGEIDDAYLAQVNGYMDALSVDKCVFIAFNKENGVMHEIVLTRDSAIVSQVRGNLLSVLNSTPEELPARPYKPDQKNILPWNCLYCSYWGKCWPTAEKVLVKNSYKLKVPDVV